MKARIGFLLVTLVLAAAVLQAAEGLLWWSNPWAESFRSASTASLLEDDLDLMLDPAMMPTIEGYRLYTNLANIVDKNEEFFNPYANNYYLIGGKTPFMGYGHLGLLYDRNFARSEDTLKVNASSTVYNNQIPVYRGVTDYTYFSSSKEQGKHWWLGFGRELGTGKIGVLVYHQGRDFEAKPFGSQNLSADIVYTDLITGRVEATAAYDDVKDSIVNESVWGGALSYWRPLTDKLDFGLAAGLNAYQATEYDTITHKYEYTNPAAGGNVITANKTEYRDIIPHDHVGAEINVRAAAIYKWNDDVRTRTDLAFSTLSGSREDGYIDVAYDSSSVFYLTAGNPPRTFTRSATMNAPVAQENSFTAVSLFSKTTAKMGEKVELSLGLGAYSAKRDHDTKWTGTYHMTDVYNDGEAAVWNDYILYADSTGDYDHMYTESQFSILAPVGLEFHITDNFVFRLGARHAFNYHDFSNVLTLTTGPVRYTQINPNNNDTTQWVNPNPYNMTNAQSEGEKYSYNETAYTYGAGWKISDHLQLDFMGFAHLDDMTGWKASAVIKF